MIRTGVLSDDEEASLKAWAHLMEGEVAIDVHIKNNPLAVPFLVANLGVSPREATKWTAVGMRISIDRAKSFRAAMQTLIDLLERGIDDDNMISMFNHEGSEGVGVFLMDKKIRVDVGCTCAVGVCLSPSEAKAMVSDLDELIQHVESKLD